MAELLYVNRSSRIARLEREHQESLRLVKMNSEILSKQLASLEDYLYMIRDDLAAWSIETGYLWSHNQLEGS